MAGSSTVIAGLKFASGVLVGSDTQATDPIALVRWPTRKVVPVGQHPLVAGFSGSLGSAQRVVSGLDALSLKANTFRRPDRVRAAIEPVFVNEYRAIPNRNYPPGTAVPDIAMWSLVAMCAGDEGHLLEFEINGESSWHEYFHAIGSGASTAYAVYRTLGGKELCELSERAAVAALLRILRTVVAVDMAGVSEPIQLWRVDDGGVHEFGTDELNAHFQFVDQWLAREQAALFELDGAS